MEGRKKEKKLMLKSGCIMYLDEIIQEIYNFFQLEESIDRKRFKNSLYTDTYYDDEENSLLKSGGSLKLRDSVDNIGMRKQTFIMRRKTSNPKKIKLEMLWEEAGVTTQYKEGDDFFKALSALKGCFYDFDFSTIIPVKILTCQTSRTEYRIQLNDEYLVVLFDRIIYTSDQNTANDSLVKLRTVGNVELMPLYEHLKKCFSDKYELVDMSRYERALYKLAQPEENGEDASPG